MLRGYLWYGGRILSCVSCFENALVEPSIFGKGTRRVRVVVSKVARFVVCPVINGYRDQHQQTGYGCE